MAPPKTMIGKLVQAADQVRWFEASSVAGTVAFGAQFGQPFFDPALALEQRLAWKPNHNDFQPDIVSALFNQLHGPTGPERLSVAWAHAWVESELKPQLRERILAEAKTRGCGPKVLRVLEAFEAALVSQK